jgi:hypothetical protein
MSVCRNASQLQYAFLYLLFVDSKTYSVNLHRQTANKKGDESKKMNVNLRPLFHI